MHSALTRLQTTFSAFTTYASLLAALVALTALLTTPVPTIPPGALTLHNIQTVKGRPHYYTAKKEEYAHVKFDLDLNLDALFTWNTKQVFLYIVASYPPPSAARAARPAELVIWDAVLPSPAQRTHHNHYVGPALHAAHPGSLALHGQRPKYQITDPSGRVAGTRNATLSLHYNVQPWVGALVWGDAAPRPSAAVSAATAAKLARREAELGDWWMRLVPGWVKGLTWVTMGGEARTGSFDMPAVKERKEAAKEAGGSLGTAKGGERGREAGFF